jgi:hypothetical protein
MALDIKNEKTQKLAQKLAKLTWESVTATGTEAVRERPLHGPRNGASDDPALCFKDFGTAGPH